MALGEEVEAGLEPAEEARLVAALAEAQRPRIEELGLEPLLREVELPLVEVLAAMEREGLKLDAERLAEVGAGFGERIETLEKEIYELAGEEFTIGSPQQVGRVLFEELGLTRKRRGKTGYSTDARVLAQIRDEHPIVEKIESWRELSKLKSTYLDSLPDLIDPETGRVHTTFNQTTAATGRLSSTNPNLQNIPIRTEIGRPVRACFVAEQGARLLSADYSQVELRVLAQVADEEVLKEIFRAGDDVHAATAAEVFNVSRDEIDVGQRSKAKMVNFGIVYGLTGFGLADRLNIPRKEGEEFVARYLERFPAVRAFREQVVERAAGGGLRDDADGPPPADPRAALGQPQHPPPRRAARGQHGDPGHRRRHHQGGDGALPGGAAREGDETRLVLQIHDELLFEGPPGEMDDAAELVRREMCAAYQLDPPLGGRRRRRPGLARRQVARRRRARARAARARSSPSRSYPTRAGAGRSLPRAAGAEGAARRSCSGRARPTRAARGAAVPSRCPRSRCRRVPAASPSPSRPGRSRCRRRRPRVPPWPAGLARAAVAGARVPWPAVVVVAALVAVARGP